MGSRSAAAVAAVGVFTAGGVMPAVDAVGQSHTALSYVEAIHTPTHRVSRSNPRRFARDLLVLRGYGGRQYRCLVRLWQRESRWNPDAYNRHTGAYGIPQRLRGKSDPVMDDYRGQIVWGVGYIKSRYGTPCSALRHQLRRGWY